MKQKPLFSVIIPCYNEEKNIIRSLNSLEKQKFKEFEVILLDDCSQDNTAKKINDFQKQAKLDMTLICKKNNEGRPKAINDALKIAKGRLIAVTDGDCVASPDWLLAIKQEFEKDPQLAAIGGVYLPLEKDAVSLMGNLFERIFMDFGLIPNLLPGANSAYRAEVLKEIGGYPARKWGADSFLGMLLKEKNKKIKMTCKAVVKTSYPHTFKKALKRKFYWGGGLASTIDKMNFKLGFFIRPAYFTLFLMSLLFTIAAVFINQSLLVTGLITTAALFFIPQLIIVLLSLIWAVSNKKYYYLNSLPLLLFLPFIQEFSYFIGFVYVLTGRKLENAWRE